MLLPWFVLLFAHEIVPTHPDIRYSQPQIASTGKITGLTFGAGDAIYYAEGESAPVKVADAPKLSLGNHRGPRLAFTTGAIVITAGVGPADRPYGPNTLMAWRSTDSGKTWARAADVSAPGVGGMGFHALASDGSRRLWAAWIAPSDGHPALYINHSEDAGLTWDKPRVLSQTVCECCHPTLTVTASGAVHVLFRNSLAGSRDFYLAASPDGRDFQFSKLGLGAWRIDACPMDGGGMAEFDGQIVTLWRREGTLFLARPNGKAEEPFAAGRNAAIALRPEGIYAVWSSAEGIMAQVPGKKPRLLSATGAFPAISPAGPVIVAWEDGGAIKTQRID